MNFKIELAREKYLKELTAISLDAAKLFSLEDLPQEIAGQTPPISELVKAMHNEMLLLVINKDTDKAIGFAWLAEECGSLHIHEIDIHPDFGQKGLGTLLLKEVIALAENRNFKQITLTTFVHLPWNAPFYAKSGFKIIAANELNPCQKKIYENETNGLDKSKRVFMVLDLK